VHAAQIALIGGAAIAGGIVNAIAGGGSLLTFPALVAAGLPSLIANLTNTVAMCPGYFGATIAQRGLLVGQRARLLRILPAGAVGGALGAFLLLVSGEAAFNVIVPFLLVFAAALLAGQNKLRSLLVARGRQRGRAYAEAWAALPVGLAAIYGGYFGAGLGVIVLAALAVVLDDDLVRVNALKQTVSLVVNVTAAVVFVASGRVDWLAAGVMAVGALVGGLLGGVVASRVPARVLRAVVVVCALALAAYYFSRLL
jgi:uncharacterized membrane protein YfcA